MSSAGIPVEQLEYARAGSSKTPHRLAGTILVTRIIPVIVAALGPSSIPETIFVTITGVLLIPFLTEPAAVMPERAGGSPAYALSG
jgi:hypothetical protein